MPDDDPAERHPAGAGLYFSTWGPLDGPILVDDRAPVLQVVCAPDDDQRIGSAYPQPGLNGNGNWATLFKLVIHGVQLPGLWLCVGRQFFPATQGATLDR
jgi:hypothetical protein